MSAILTCMYNFIVVQLSPLQMAAANGGEPAEVERDDVNQAVKDMYEEEGGRAAVIDEITKEMGEGHEGGQKGVLIERLTTIRLLKAKKTNGDDEKTEALLNVDESDDFDEGPAAGAADDRTSWTFNTAKMTLKKVNEMQQTLKKSCLSLRSHELQYMVGARGFCTVCPFTEQAEGHVGCQSTQLMCTTCRTWVCKASACLMAHLKHGHGRACTDRVWEGIEVSDNQHQYRPASENSLKRPANRTDD